MQFFRGIHFISPDLFRNIFRGLKYRNYRYYFWGQSVSLIGTWVQNIAMSWLVYRLTGSALLLGTVVFALQIPSLFITPFAGVLADRWNRRKIIILTQVLAMLVAFFLAWMVLTDRITVTWIITIAVFNGIILAFDTPFRQAFVPDIITQPEDLGNAIALNSSLYNLARFIGPPIGGLLISLVGEGWCFFINGASFVAVIAGLLAIQIEKTIRRQRAGSIIQQLVEGLKYAWHFRSLRYLLLLLIFSSFFGLPFQALMPIFAADILKGDAQMLGFLTGALGAGALSGALFLASRKNLMTVPALTFRTALMFALGLAIFALSPLKALSMLALVVTGFGMIVHFNATNTLLQSIADEEKRGRIVSLYSLTFMGITPLGSLAAGALADYIGVPFTVFAFSLICLSSAMLFGKRVRLIMLSLGRKMLK
ncbi:MAG: MFS transporter [Bacteroidales bacterium]|nr:MFS transporter [Bacteroidales bacterium]